MSQNFKANSNVTQKIQEGKRNVKAQHNSMSHKKEGFKRLQISTRLNWNNSPKWNNVIMASPLFPDLVGFALFLITKIKVNKLRFFK